MIDILITGGSGLVGKRLTQKLLARGHRVSHLGRKKIAGEIPSYTWNVEQHFLEPGFLHGVDTIIHLAGAGIADKPWTAKRKKEILESRTNSTRLLFDELKKGNHTVKTFISASAIGYYGFYDQPELLREEHPPGHDFHSTMTQRWEREVDAIESLAIRVVKIRTGIVLSEQGGALEEIARPVKYFVGAPLGTGEQFLSWIHMDDLCGIYSLAVEDSLMTGTYNGVSPSPVSNRALTKAIARVLHRPLILPPIPGFLLKFLLGEMADLVLRGAKVSAEKIIRKGYVFKFTDIDKALEDLLMRK